MDQPAEWNWASIHAMRVCWGPRFLTHHPSGGTENPALVPIERSTSHTGPELRYRRFTLPASTGITVPVM